MASLLVLFGGTTSHKVLFVPTLGLGGGGNVDMI